MQETWLGSQLSHNLTSGSLVTSGSSVGLNCDLVFTTYQAKANLQPAYQAQIVGDVPNLPFVIRHQFLAFQLSRKEVLPNFEHERQEREAVYVYWGADANDLGFGIPSIFPEEEVTNNYLPGYGPPLGEDWPNRDDESAEVLLPETPGTIYASQPNFPNNAISQWQ